MAATTNRWLLWALLWVLLNASIMAATLLTVKNWRIWVQMVIIALFIVVGLVADEWLYHDCTHARIALIRFAMRRAS